MLVTGPHDIGIQDVAVIHHARAGYHRGSGTGSLSIKCRFDGQSTYTLGDARFRVDDDSYLVLNEGQAYSFVIDSETEVESFNIFFDALHIYKSNGR